MAGALSAELGGRAEMEAPRPCARHLCWLAERLSCVGRGATTRARGRRLAAASQGGGLSMSQELRLGRSSSARAAASRARARSAQSWGPLLI